ncbi:hypothetical protein BCR44DRAFT_38051, partial [Catenaria anguillulae PL171]
MCASKAPTSNNGMIQDGGGVSALYCPPNAAAGCIIRLGLLLIRLESEDAVGGRGGGVRVHLLIYRCIMWAHPYMTNDVTASRWPGRRLQFQAK